MQRPPVSTQTPSSSSSSSSSPVPKLNSISDCPESFARWYCLNGATCFSVKIQESVLYNCWCPVGFHGLRCDFKYITENGGRRDKDADNRAAGDSGRRPQVVEHPSAIRLVGGGDPAGKIITIKDADSNEDNFSSNVEIYLIIVYLVAFTFLIFVLIILSIQIIRKLRSITGSTRVVAAAAAPAAAATHLDQAGGNGTRVINPNPNNNNTICTNNSRANDDPRRTVAVELDQILARNLERRLRAVGQDMKSTGALGPKQQQQQQQRQSSAGSPGQYHVTNPGRDMSHHRPQPRPTDGQLEHHQSRHHQQRPASPLEPVWFC